MFKVFALCTLSATINGIPSHKDAHHDVGTVATQAEAQLSPVQLLKSSLSDPANKEYLNTALLPATHDESIETSNITPSLRLFWFGFVLGKRQGMMEAMMMMMMMPPAMMPPGMMMMMMPMMMPPPTMP